MTENEYKNTNELENDPRMTAWLLGELGPEETAEWERILDENPGLREESETMRRTIDLVRDAFAREPVANDTEPVAAVKRPEKRAGHKGGNLLVACVVLVAVGIAVVLARPNLAPSLSRLLFTTPEIADEHVAEHTAEHAVEHVTESGTVKSDAKGAPVAEVPAPVHNKLREESRPESRPESKLENTPREDNRGGDAVSVGMSSVNRDGGASIDRQDAKPVVASAPAPVKKRAVPAASAEASAPVPGKASAVSAYAGQTMRMDSQNDKPQRNIIAGEEIREQAAAPAARGRKEKAERESAMGAPSNGNRFGRGMDVGMGGGMDGMRGLRGKGESAYGVYGAAPAVTSVDSDIIMMQKARERSDEGYGKIKSNDFVAPKDQPFSTFSIDVDTASYSNVRRFLNMGQLPPADAVKIEEMVNYFKYDNEPPKADAKEPFATRVEVVSCPWEKSHLIAKIGIKGKVVPKAKRQGLSLVFLLDVSGSMSSPNKLPLVKRAMEELVEQLDERDKVAIVTYAGSSHVHLETTKGAEHDKILKSIDVLTASGSTAGADGIRTAYELATKQYDRNAANRVVLCTDGDFNVGTTDNKELEDLIGAKAKSGVFLTILGFGMGNYKDDRLATLSNRGNGNYGYIDDIAEARRLLVDGLTGTLITIAKDVKIQVDFNPDQVAAWRLVGYEDRLLAAEDFHNDRKDAGEIGAGHTVTALYEIVPAGVDAPWSKQVDQSRYASPEKAKEKEGVPPAAKQEDASKFANELMFVKLRYKLPDERKSTLTSLPVRYTPGSQTAPSNDCKFALSVALFGMLLRNCDYLGDGTYDMALELANPDEIDKTDAARNEYVSLVKKAKRLAAR